VEIFSFDQAFKFSVDFWQLWILWKPYAANCFFFTKQFDVIYIPEQQKANLNQSLLSEVI